MLAIGARKTAGKPVSHGRGDAMELSFRQNSFNGITCAFGIRNFRDLKKGVKEMLRVLKPGGRVAILEFTTPDNPFIKKIYLFYFGRVVPLIGRIVSGHHNAYSYLPASVREFPDRQKLKSIFTDAGFQEVSVSPLTFGVCDLITANKPASADKALRRGGPEK
jgi:demethylmenaquinone methyltransferase/2-methoxy-6-polyprenyl-1,4-benzoquinol methylase